MKTTLLASALALALPAAGAVADTGSVRVQPGHFCALNKCVRFSRDLSEVSIQGRRPVSVAGYGLRSNPVISAGQYRQIFYLALRQRGVNGNRE